MPTLYLEVDPRTALAIAPWTPPPAEAGAAEQTPADCFTADLAANFHAKGDADIGWRWDGSRFVDPATGAPTPASVEDLLAYVGTKQAAVLAATTWSFDLGAADAPLVATTRLDAKGISSMQSLALWAILNSASTVARQAYSNVDWSALSLSPQQALVLATRAGDIVSTSYATLVDASAGILATPPTITSLAAIDALTWPAPAA